MKNSSRNPRTAYPKKLVLVYAKADETVEIHWLGNDGAVVMVQETVPHEVMTCEEREAK